MVNRDMSKVLAICVDSMSLDYIRPHLDRLPAFRSLLETGALSRLQTSAAPLTASIWASFATGEHPGVHGHYYPFQWDPDRMDFARAAAPRWADRLDYEPFWYGLAREGVKTIAFDPGTSYVLPGAQHTEIVNWSYQSTGAVSATDPALLAELRRRFGHRPIGKEIPVPKTLAHSRRMRDDLIKAIEAKANAALWLMEREDWRLFLTGFYEVHRAGHNLLVVEGDYGSQADPDALLAVNEAQDRALARLLEKAASADTTAIVFSMHGMIPNWSQEHFTGRIMERLADAWNVAKGDAPRPPKAENLMAQLREKIPPQIQFRLAYMLGEHVQDWVVNRAVIGGIDWATTPAFRIASGGEGYIRLNIKGREREGCLEPGEAAGYVAWLKDRLAEIKVAGAGAPFFRELIDVSAIMPGERSRYLPDLVIVYAPEEPVSAIESPAIGRLEARLGTGRGGNHAPDAYMIVTGPGKSSPARGHVGDIADMRGFIETLLLSGAAAAPQRAASLADA